MVGAQSLQTKILWRELKEVKPSTHPGSIPGIGSWSSPRPRRAQAPEVTGLFLSPRAKVKEMWSTARVSPKLLQRSRNSISGEAEGWEVGHSECTISQQFRVTFSMQRYYCACPGALASGGSWRRCVWGLRVDNRGSWRRCYCAG